MSGTTRLYVFRFFRNLPLSVFISMGIVTLVYVLYNVALYVVMSPEEVLLSPAAGVVCLQSLPKHKFQE